MRVLESHGKSRDERDSDRVAVIVSGENDDYRLAKAREEKIPMRAASLSFRLLVTTGAWSASVISRSGRAKGSNIPPAACRMRTVPSRCRSFMWFILTA